MKLQNIEEINVNIVQGNTDNSKVEFTEKAFRINGIYVQSI